MPVVDWLFNKRQGGLVYGGRLAGELGKVAAGRRILTAALRAGIAILIDEERIETEEINLQSSGLLRSNDPHVIALAKVGGARVLFSHDQALHADFTNPQLLNRPRGKIYQNSSHQGLLTGSACRAN